ncbi:MAG: SPFH domain-containing protein, partial [Actinomycetota bacterium]|nr:SPFH domain-containing protein [Actinomycetota bacterium]
MGVAVLLLLLLILVKSVLIVVTEYERGVFFRLGKVLAGARGPGVVFRIPAVDRVVKVNLRVEVVDIPPQAVITQD